jgi:quercetin dioxygenase-like cupin family protein
MDLAVMAASAGEQTGVIWTLRESSDLNANLVRFEAGEGVGEHINDEVDVIFVGVSGTGSVLTNGEERRLSAGTLVLVRKGTRRSTLALSEGFSYLTVHLRRGPLQLGQEAQRSAPATLGRPAELADRSFLEFQNQDTILPQREGTLTGDVRVR